MHLLHKFRESYAKKNGFTDRTNEAFFFLKRSITIDTVNTISINNFYKYNFE
jgi:hypothetical protein